MSCIYGPFALYRCFFGQKSTVGACQEKAQGNPSATRPALGDVGIPAIRHRCLANKYWDMRQPRHTMDTVSMEVDDNESELEPVTSGTNEENEEVCFMCNRRSCWRLICYRRQVLSAVNIVQHCPFHVFNV